MINEVMYDPLENDNYYEWVELYNPTNESVNISGWTLSDNYAEDFLETESNTSIPAKSYAIITDIGTKFYDNYTLPNNTLRISVDDKSIGNGLGNSGDKLVLKNNLNETVDSVEWIKNYTDVEGNPFPKTSEGFSLSRYNRDTNDTSKDFYESLEPTPGYKNKITEYGNTKIYCNQTSYLIRKDENFEVFLNLENSGDYFDNITLKTESVTEGWDIKFKEKILPLNSNESANTSIIVSAGGPGLKNCEIKVIAKSEKEYNTSDSIELFFEISNPDLTIRNIKLYNEAKNEKNIFGQGEIIRIKAFLKNYGRQNATNVKVGFYLDEINADSYLGCKYYDSVSKYQKYPSIIWDSQGVLPGKHKLIVVADKENNIDEIDEYNNKLITSVEIFNTTTNKTGRSLLITEVYYHSHPSLFNEFIVINNPSNSDFDISGWYLTNNPDKIRTEQTKIIFPNNTIIKANSKILLTESAKNYSWETGGLPDFEYNIDSDPLIAQMISSKKFIMSNKGCMLGLKDTFNHTIDLVIYGNVSSKNKCWTGPAVSDSGQGNILKRNKNVNFFDTNTPKDWMSNRVYRIGQSDFSSQKISFNGVVKTFVSPDCSYNVIVDELQNASESIYFNIYEFTNSFLCDELINALLRGVSVNIFVEGSPIGGISDEQKIILSRLNDYGGNIRFIISDKQNDIYARYMFDHAKYLVIDNKTVIVESCNWAETGVPKNPTYGNREWGVVIKNEDVANYFLNVFLDDYDPNRCDSVSFENMSFSIPSEYFVKTESRFGRYKPAFESLSLQSNFSVTPVFSPDTSYSGVYELLDSATKSIYIQQLYIYNYWDKKINPFVDLLVKKAEDGVDVKVILNYNYHYKDTNEKLNQTKEFFQRYNVNVKFIYSNWSYFTNVHNKGAIVDNRSVLISSINWNENSFTNNREAGVIIENEEIARYYCKVFFYDWNLTSPDKEEIQEVFVESDYKNTIYIIVIFTMTFALIARDWRKRKWT